MRVDPDDLPWVVTRPHITAMLAERWQRRVVNVVAGAGFGKSMAMAFAMRDSPASDGEAPGTDYLVRLDATSGSAARFVKLLAAALEVEGDSDDPVEIVRALAERGGEHCVIFDDVHELPIGSAAERALPAILERLPANVGLVFLSRSPSPLPLARHRAAGQVLDIGEEELAYTPEELRDIAEMTDTAWDDLETTSGWPALVSLVVSRGHHGAWEFLAEEVLAALDPQTRDALIVAALADGANAQLISRVTGYRGELRSIASAVPLVTIDATGRLIPHALWSEVLHHQRAEGGQEQLLRTLADELLRVDEPFAALRVALRLEDRILVARAARALCAAEYIGFDSVELHRLLEAAPPGFEDLPEGRLLTAIFAAHSEPMAESTRLALEASVREFRRLRVVDCEVVALSELAMVLRWQSRSKRLLFIIRRLYVLANRGHVAAARLAAFARAVIADRVGDSTKSLAAVADLRRGHLHDGWIALIDFVRCHQLLNLGRIREAYDAATRSKELGVPGFHGGWCSAHSAAWHLGVTRERVDVLPFADEVEDASPIDQVWIGAWFGAMQAYAGRYAAAARNLATAERALHARHDTQLVGFVVWARAAIALAENDEHGARRELRRYLRSHRVTSLRGQRLAARAPAVVDLLLGDELPDGWAAPLSGPWQQAMLDTAGALRALRAGQPVGRVPEPGLILCALPLPWAVEFATRAELAGHPQAFALAGHILDVSDDAVHPVIERFVAPELQAAATRLFTAKRHVSHEDAGLLASLTAAERRVLSKVTEGGTNQQIAAELGISVRTVANHLYNLYAKLGVASRTEAALMFQEANQ